MVANGTIVPHRLARTENITGRNPIEGHDNDGTIPYPPPTGEVEKQWHESKQIGGYCVAKNY